MLSGQSVVQEKAGAWGSEEKFELEASAIQSSSDWKRGWWGGEDKLSGKEVG